MTRSVVCAMVLSVLPSIVLGQTRVATPTFSVGGGEYSTVVMVRVRVNTPGATIRFTQDGRDPTESDPVIVSGATLAVNTSLTLKARAWKIGLRPSEVRSATYRMLSTEIGPPIGPGDAAAGRAHAVLARPDGRVFEWNRERPPALVAPMPPVVSLAAGSNHTLAITRTGDVYAWGANGSGQLGDGTLIRRKWPVRVPGLANIVRISAGRLHSLALTADGRVYAWGANDRGQLSGGTESRARVWAPIETPANVIAIEAGDDHSLAVTAGGELFAWGANEHGQLGDGSRTNRDRPVRIALDDVIAVAAGRNYTLALRRDGSVYSWGAGARGQLGTDSRNRALVPTRISGLLAHMVAAGQAYSAAIRRDGALVAWGSNTSGQLGDGTEIDRAQPVVVPGISGVSTLSLGRRQAVAVTASGNVWTWGGNAAPSTILTGLPDWGPAIGTPAELPAPTIAPLPAAYPGPQTVTIAGAVDAIVRYTVDGSDPTETSTIYTEPFTVATTATVKARAFSSNGGLPSPIAAHLYTIDPSPPSIAIEVSPPLTTEWMTTPLLVTFTCGDDSGIVSCPPPLIVGEGAAQLITGTATDPAGNHASVAIIANVDLTPPAVVFTNAPEATTEPTLILAGSVSDAVSGLAGVVSCNGEPVSLTENSFTCLVPLQPGVNTITLQAEDVAGHVMAGGVTVTRVGDSTSLAIVPESRTLLINQETRFSLQDEFGAVIGAATWSTSDAAIVSLSTDDPPMVMALAPGIATITAEKDGLAAEANVIVQAGVALAPGTIRWRVAPTPGYQVRDLIFTHRVDATVPEMFIVEEHEEGDTRLRATTSDGAVRWQQHSPGIPLMGDEFGGVLAGVPYDEGATRDFRAYVRIGTAGGVRPWRYESAGSLERPAQAPDGAVHAIEYVLGRDPAGDDLWDKHLVVIDGRNGKLLRRLPIARETLRFTAALDGQVIRERPLLICRSTYEEDVAATAGPVIGSDGQAYYLVRRRASHLRASCLASGGGLRPAREIDLGIDLVVMSANAPPVIRSLHSEHCEAPEAPLPTICDGPFSVINLMPDGLGGMLASWTRTATVVSQTTVRTERLLTRWDENNVRTDRVDTALAPPDFIGQAGIAYRGAYNAFDVVSGQSRWSHNYNHFIPLAATPDGGVAMLDRSSAQLHTTDANGHIVSTQPFPLDASAVQEFGQWIGFQQGVVVSVEGQLDDATRWRFGGNHQFQGQLRNPGQGIFLKSHWAFEGLSTFKHLSIRIVPSNQVYWRGTDPSGFLPRDVFGNHFMTFGAGTGPNDTSAACSGTLTKGKNRDRDVLEQPASLDRYPVARGAAEDTAIWALVEGFSHYRDHLPYACFPESNPGFYNSNSFARGLQDAAGLTAPLLGPNIVAPGWFTPVPRQYFQVGQ